MCDNDGYCHAPGTPLCPALADASPPDAPPDAPMVDARPPPTRRWRFLSAGHTHTCGLDREDRLYCWGDGEHGKLGIGSTERTASPQALAGTWITVAAGGNHTCGIRQGGTLYCWGDNGAGQLGREGLSESHEPVQVRAPDTGWTAVSTGQAHTCGINGGALYCFGSNGFVQLGLGSYVPFTAATPQRVGDAANWTQVSLGMQHTCGLRGMALYCWGDEGKGRLGLGAPTMSFYPSPVRIGGETSQWQAVAAGFTSTCAIATEGTLWCWGSNDYGELGCAPEMACDSSVFVPVKVDSRTGWDQVSVGEYHACASLDGTLECWGFNLKGQLGRGAFDGEVTARRVDAPPDRNGWSVSEGSLSVGKEHTCALMGDDSSWCFGSSSDGQRGDGETVDQPLPAPMRFAGGWRDVSVGWPRHACGISDRGVLLCWGANQQGQLGNGGKVDSLVPTAVDTTLEWTAIEVGQDFSCALGRDKAVYCWGSNVSGELGSSSSGLRPAKVSFTGASDWQQLSVGERHACGIRQAGSDRTVWCWGVNTHGQAGGTADPQLTPAQVDRLGLPNWDSVSAGALHTCAIRAGQLWCWGLGATAPVRLGTDADWTQMSSGYEETCGIRFNGTQRTLWCAPHRLDAEAPLGALVDKAGVDWQSVAYGAFHACALTLEGKLWCWGDNDFGQVGDGTRTYRHIPMAVAETEVWAEVSLGDSFGCARHFRDNRTWCWGLGHRGQLGLGVASRPSPVPVLD
jgi:alpha-tubulin suppressor-like RCC1 family protein